MEQQEITTKDLQALNELMTFENWIAIKMHQFSLITEEKNLKKTFDEMAQAHYTNHNALLEYLAQNGGQN